MNKNNSMIPDDFKSEFGGAESMLDNNNNQSMMLPPGMKKLGGGTQMRHGTSTTRAGQNILMNKTTSRLGSYNNNGDPAGLRLKKNNLMSDKGDM